MRGFDGSFTYWDGIPAPAITNTFDYWDGGPVGIVWSIVNLSGQIAGTSMVSATIKTNASCSCSAESVSVAQGTLRSIISSIASAEAISSVSAVPRLIYRILGNIQTKSNAWGILSLLGLGKIVSVSSQVFLRCNLDSSVPTQIDTISEITTEIYFESKIGA